MRKRLLVGVAVLSLLSVPFQVRTIAAQATYETPTTALDKTHRHCITGPGTPLLCFQTEEQALLVASGGYIHLAPGQTSADLTDSELFAPAASLQGTLYEHADYGGATLTIFGDGCNIWNNMQNGWNDITSSVRTNSCGLTLYESYNKTGTSLTINSPGTTYVGTAMNDKASSWSIP